MSSIITYLQEFFAWLFDLLLYIPLKIAELGMAALATVLEAIPVPSFVSNAGGAFAAIPPSVMFFADFLQLGTGMSIVVTAYTVRFFIRRMPVIG